MEFISTTECSSAGRARRSGRRGRRFKSDHSDQQEKAPFFSFGFSKTQDVAKTDYKMPEAIFGGILASNYP